MANLVLKNNTAGGKTSVTADEFIGNATSASKLKYANQLTSQEDIDGFLDPLKFQVAAFKTADTNNVGMASNDGMILSIPWTNTAAYGAQLAFDDATSGVMKFRGKGQTWGAWKTVLHDGNYNNWVPSKTGTGASGTWGINITGNAATANKLSTARTIALSGGATGTATGFDGSANISIPVTSIKEAYLTWGGKSFAGAYGPIDAAMVPELGANRLAFMPPAGIEIQYSRDNGSTWTDYNVSDDVKINLFNGNGGTPLIIGGDNSTKIDKSQYQLRVIITTNIAKVYTALNKFCIYCSTNGSNNCWCTIDVKTKANVDNNVDTWITYANKVAISGWSGYSIINTGNMTTYGNTKDQFQKLRFTFGVGSHSSSSAYTGLSISKIMGFGGVGWVTPSTLAKTGHMYTYDAGQNVTFPGSLSVSRYLYIKSPAWPGDIIATNAAGKKRYELFSNSSNGAVADTILYVYTDDTGSAIKRYIFGTNGTLTASAFAGHLIGNADTAANISSYAPILAVGIEHNDITVKTDASNKTGTLRNALDFQWYDTHWQIGNIRGNSTNSLGLGFAYSEDGTTYTLKSKIDTDGNYILTGRISFQTTNFTSTPVRVYDDGTNYGHTLVISASGTTYVGGGESAETLKTTLNSTQENLYLSADRDIYFYTNCNTIGNRIGIIFNTTNQFYPLNNNTISLGVAGYKWSHVYATTLHGTLDGNASTATALQTARTLTIGNKGKTFDGSGNVTWTLSEIGAASLGSDGKVPSSQLPSYVDDVIDGYLSNGKFYKESDHTTQLTAESSKIYVDLHTNKTYRWSGSAYVEISASLVLGTTANTAFRGDYGNTAYNHANAKGSAFASGLYKITTNAQGHVIAAAAVTKADITALGIPGTNTTYGAAGSSLGLVKTGGDVTINNGIITVNDDSHNHTIANIDNLQTTLDKKVKINDANIVYTGLGHYYNAGSTAKYIRIDLPSVATWAMMTMELTIRQNYQSGKAGKLFIYGNYSSDDWYNFYAIYNGTLDSNIKVYGSDKKYIYIGGLAAWGGLSLDRMTMGDNATTIDLSKIVFTGVSELPATYQTADMKRSWVQGDTIVGNLSGNASTASGLLNTFSRPTSADINLGSSTYSNKVTYMLATSSMTTGKPPTEAHILSFGWDTNAGWGSQLAISNDQNCHLYIRGANGVNNNSSWESWKTVLDSTNYTSYVPTKTGSGASGTWGININGWSKSVLDINGSNTITFGYSQAGLNYGDYTYLAAWNGYSLRAINKSQFAQASHTHSYLPLSGGILTGALTFKTNAYAGDIVGRNANGQARYEFYSNSNSGAIAPAVLRVYNNEAGSTYATYQFGTNGTLTASTFAGSLSGNASTASKLKYADQLTSQEAIDDFLEGSRFQIATFDTSDANNIDMVSNDGIILSMSWTDADYGAQLAFDDTVEGAMKFRGKGSTWGNWRTVLHDGNYSSYALPLSGGTMTGTLVINKTTDASGTSNNWPALIIGGTTTSEHIEIDSNEIMAKSDGTTPNDLYINDAGGTVHIGPDGLKISKDNATAINWLLTLHETGNANSTGWGSGIKFQNASDNDSKFCGIAGYASSPWANGNGLVFYTDGGSSKFWMEGNKFWTDIIVLHSSSSYGSTYPDYPSTGQLFFKI